MENFRQYGLIATRADRCTYVMYGQEKKASLKRTEKEKDKSNLQPLDAIEYLLDPIMNNNAQGRRVHGTVRLRVDDLFLTGDSYFHKTVVNSLRKDFQVGSEDVNDVMFVGRHIKWVTSNSKLAHLRRHNLHQRNCSLRLIRRPGLTNLQRLNLTKAQQIL